MIKELITKLGGSLPTYEYEEPVAEEGYTFSLEKRFGGREGAGEEHWVVLKVEKDGVDEFWKIPGYYASYNGADLEFYDAYKVKAVEKTVTVWEKDA